MFQKNIIIASFYIILVIPTPLITAIPLGVISPLDSGLILFQMVQMILAALGGIDNFTGNRVTNAFSWTWSLVANGTRTVTGTMPLPALAFLVYKLPTTVRKITNKLGIDVKDIPKVIFNQGDRPSIKRWRRL